MSQRPTSFRSIRRALCGAVLPLVLLASLLPAQAATSRSDPAGNPRSSAAVNGILADIAIDPSSTVAYATNSTANEVEVVSIATGRLGTPIAVGAHPQGLALSPDGSRLYVANSGGYDVSVVDVPAAKELHRISVPRATSLDDHPFSIATASNGVALLTTTFAGSGATRMLQINLNSEAVTERTDVDSRGAISENTHLAASGDHSKVAVSASDISSGAVELYNASDDTFSPEVDLQAFVGYPALDKTGSTALVNSNGGTYLLDGKLNLSGTISAGGTSVSNGTGAAIDPGGARAYRAETSHLDVLDTSRFLPLATIPLPESIGNGRGTLAVSPDAATVAVLTATGVSVVKVASQVAVTPPSGPPSDVVIDPTSRHAFATNPALNQVDVVSLSNGAHQSPILVGSQPKGLGLSPDGARLYVANTGGGNVSVVDVASGLETHRIQLPRTRFGIDHPFSIAIANNGLAFVAATGGLPHLLQIDLSSETVTQRTDINASGVTTDQTHIAPSGDHSMLAIASGGVTPGPVYLYDAGANTFTPEKDLSTNLGYVALNGAGSTVAVDPGSYVLDGHLNQIGTIPGGGRGFALDSMGAKGYRVQSSSIDVLDMSRLLMVATIALPEGVGNGSGNVALSPDGTALAALTATGISLVRVANQVAVAPPAGGITDVVIDPSSTHAFAANAGLNEVEVVNLGTGGHETPIPVGSQPKGLALTPDGKTLYVANSGGSDVSVVDVPGRHELHRIPVPANSITNDHPFSLAIASNGLALLTTTFAGSGSARLLQINLSTEAVTPRTDSGISVTEDTHLTASGDHSKLGMVDGGSSAGAVSLYTAVSDSFAPAKDLNAFVQYIALDQTGSTVAVDHGTYLLGSSLGLQGTIAGGGSGVALDSTGAKGYRVQTSSIDVLDIKRQLVVASIALPESVGNASGNLALSADGTTLAAVTANGISVARVDGQVAVPAPTGGMSEVVIDASSTHAFATNTFLNEVDVVALATKQKESPIAVGSQPKGLALTPDGKTLYVANSGGSDVSVVDVATRRETHRILIPSAPQSNESPFSIAVAGNGRALLTTTFAGSGAGAHMLEINLATEKVSPRTDFSLNGATTEDTHIASSGDHSKLGVIAGDVSSAPVFIYDSASNAFTPAKNLNAFIHQVALDQTASTLLVNGGTYALDGQLNLLGTISGGGSGVALNTAGTRGYRVQPAGVDVIDMQRLLPTASIPLPERVGTSSGNIAASPDGGTLAVLTGSGISVLAVSAQVAVTPPGGPLSDVVIDPVSQHAFATDTALNQVVVVSLATGVHENPIPVGSQPKGLGLTPDGRMLYVANAGGSNVSVVDVAARHELHRITVPADVNTNDRPYSIAVASNGLAMLTTTFDGSGFGAHMMQINLASEAVNQRPEFFIRGQTTERTHITASGDHSRLAVVAGDISSGPVFIYKAATDTFTAEKDLSAEANYVALDKTGATVAVDPGTYLLDGTPTLTGSIGGGGMGVALNSLGTRGYRVQPTGVDVLDVTNMRTEGSLALPEPVGKGSGNIAMSSDDTTLAVITATGVSLVRVPLEPLAGVVGSDGALYTTNAPPRFQGSGGYLLAAPAVVSVPNVTGLPTPLYIAVGGDHVLYVRSNTAPWQRLVTSGCWDNPTALVTPDGAGGHTLTVGCEGGDRALYYWQTPVTATALPSITTTYMPLGGVLAAGPAVSVIGGKITFEVVGADQNVYSKAIGDVAYAQVPAACIGHPAVAGSGSTAYMACHGLDGHLYYSLNSGSGWRPFRSAGGLLIDGPGLAVTPAGVVVYVEGTNGQLFHTIISADGASAGPFDADGGLIQFGAGATGP